MNHAFFSNIDWQKLREKKPTGNYLAQPPRTTIEEYQKAFPYSDLSKEEINDIYNADDDEYDTEEDNGQKNYYGPVNGWEFICPNEINKTKHLGYKTYTLPLDDPEFEIQKNNRPKT